MLGFAIRFLIVSVIPAICNYGFKYLVDHTHKASLISDITRAVQDDGTAEKIAQVVAQHYEGRNK